jgi:hypothetical protein
MAKKSGNKSKSKTKSNIKSSELNIIKSPLMQAVDKIENKNVMNVNQVSSNIIILSMMISIIVLIINVNALLWINKLDTMNCACSESYMRAYIKYYLYFIIVINSVDIILFMYLYSNNISLLELTSNSLYNIYTSFKLIFSIFSIINIVIVIIFINKLKELNCECSEDIRREVYWIYNIILVCYIGIVILLAMIGLFAMLSNKS